MQKTRLKIVYPSKVAQDMWAGPAFHEKVRGRNEIQESGLMPLQEPLSCRDWEK
jgi:hypothetical protein